MSDQDLYLCWVQSWIVTSQQMKEYAHTRQPKHGESNWYKSPNKRLKTILLLSVVSRQWGLLTAFAAMGQLLIS